MEEAETLCHRLAIMDRGRLVAIDTPSNLVGLLDAAYTVKLVSPTPLPDGQLDSLNRNVAPVQALGNNTYLLRLNKAPNTLDRALHEIVGSNLTLEHLEITPVSLEDVFLSITGHELLD
jgi:ABC-2 type transport system ATP-binding protein